MIRETINFEINLDDEKWLPISIDAKQLLKQLLDKNPDSRIKLD